MSKLINKARLEQFATGLWDKIKGRYDEAFKDVALTPNTSTDKKLTFTKINNSTKEIDLADYARLTDQNNFKKDVAADDGTTDNTLKYGTLNGNENNNRASGHRGVTTAKFKDGYVKHIIALADETQNVGDQSNWEVWAIKKGTTRNDDRVIEKFTLNNIAIKNMPINGNEQKVVELPIDRTFDEEAYFITRCSGRSYKVVNVNTSNQNDVVNLSSVPGGTGSTIQWNTNANNNIAVIFLYGRESIGSLSAKIDKVNSDSSTYVKHTDCTVQGGAIAQAGKVVKLGTDGKLDSSLMPKIAINEYYTVSTFNNTTLASIIYENGDIVVATDTTKRYLCVNKGSGSNTTNDFIELNSKDGVVQSVNGKTGQVELSLTATTENLKLNITSNGQTVTKEVDIITQGEITSIITNLQ